MKTLLGILIARWRDLAHTFDETVVTCGLVVEQRTHHQINGEPMKFRTPADWMGTVETELFAQTYKRGYSGCQALIPVQAMR